MRWENSTWLKNKSKNLVDSRNLSYKKASKLERFKDGIEKNCFRYEVYNDLISLWKQNYSTQELIQIIDAFENCKIIQSARQLLVDLLEQLNRATNLQTIVTATWFVFMIFDHVFYQVLNYPNNTKLNSIGKNLFQNYLAQAYIHSLQLSKQCNSSETNV
ncbi:MAG: hypothetical protein OHK0017_00510 [Patescibacteria group bacterium]